MEELFEFDLSDVEVAAFESVVTPAVDSHPNEVQTSGQLPSLQPATGEQISSQLGELHNSSHHHQHPELPQDEQEHLQLADAQHQHHDEQMHDKLQPPAPPPPLQQQTSQTIQIQLQQKHQLTASQQIQLQQQLQNQITTASGQQPCKILLIPINSTKSGTPGLKPTECFIPGFKNLIQLPQGASTLTMSSLKTPTTTNSSSKTNSFSKVTHSSNHPNSTTTSKKLQTVHHNIQFPSLSAAPPSSQQQSQKLTSSPNRISNEVPKRKPCNCTKSQCLKLYCDCFANGEFCSGCNCKDCYNSLSKEKERQKAISQCLERNPEAFRPKIGKAVKGAAVGEPAPEAIERRHTKGCNCKRSGCLKNYCECYEAKILCSNLCKCYGCKNYEESFERKTLMQLANSSSDTARGILRSLLPLNSTNPSCSAFNNQSHSNSLNMNYNTTRQGSSGMTKNFINKEVIQASLVCLLQSAQQAEKDGVPSNEIPNLIQTEMGKCLRMIVNSIANESPQTSASKKR